MKICIHCTHARFEGPYGIGILAPRCARPGLPPESLATGRPACAETERFSGLCGTEGKFYEERAKPLTIMQRLTRALR